MCTGQALAHVSKAPHFLRQGQPRACPQQGGRLLPWEAQAHQLSRPGSRPGSRGGSETSHAPAGYLRTCPSEAQTWLGAGNQAEATLGTGVPAEPGAGHPVSPTNAAIRPKDCTTPSPAATGPRHRAHEMRQVPMVPCAAIQGRHKEDGGHLVNDSHVDTHGHKGLNILVTLISLASFSFSFSMAIRMF